MRKGLIVLLAAFLVGAFALPATAEITLTGFVRTKAWVSNFDRFDAGTVIPGPEGSGDAGTSIGAPGLITGRRLLEIDTSNSASYVETRGRLKFDAKGENVGAVAFFEVDARWGDSQYAVGRNQGFALEGDTVNLETKNLYVWFKPNADTTVSVGLQGFTDSYRGIIFGVADMAGVFVTGKFAPVNYRLGWAKLQDGSAAGGAGNGTERDLDVDFYVAEVKFAPTADARLGFNAYYIRDSIAAGIADTINSYYLGVDGSVKLAPVTLSGFFLYNFGTFDDPAGDTDISAYAANVRADMDLGPGKFFIEALYTTGQDAGSSDYESLLTGSNWALAGSFYHSTDMQILFPNIDDINSSAALAYDVANLGSGLLHVGAGYSQKFSDKVSGKIGLGWLAANEELILDDETQAIEFNGNVNYNLAKGLDLGVYAAYALLGDAYDFVSGTDVDDPWLGYARLNYSF